MNNLNERRSLVDDLVWERRGAINVCRFCGAVEEGTAGATIEHWRRCQPIARAARADRIVDLARELLCHIPKREALTLRIAMALYESDGVETK